MEDLPSILSRSAQNGFRPVRLMEVLRIRSCRLNVSVMPSRIAFIDQSNQCRLDVLSRRSGEIAINLEASLMDVYQCRRLYVFQGAMQSL